MQMANVKLSDGALKLHRWSAVEIDVVSWISSDSIPM